MQEEVWRAITASDPAYDGRFFYAVRTTGIFCRPSCKSRVPNRENVVVFTTAGAAVAAGFRACKRCRPDQCQEPATELAQQAQDYIDQHDNEPISLQLMAERLHVSPYHLHHTFKRIAGVTPMAYLRHRRVLKARQLLAESDLPLTEVALCVGFSSAAHFSTVFRKEVGQSPSSYRSQMQGLNLHGH